MNSPYPKAAEETGVFVAIMVAVVFFICGISALIVCNIWFKWIAIPYILMSRRFWIWAGKERIRIDEQNKLEEERYKR